MWAELFSSVLGGGVTGLLGAVVSKVADYKTKQLDIHASEKKYAHEIQMRQADAAIMKEEFAARVQIAQTESASREAIADAQAFTASFNEPQRYSEGASLDTNQTWLMVGLDFIRGIVRPGLTLYLCAITTIMYIEAQSLLGQGVTGEQAYGLVKDIVNTVLYLCTCSVLWYFGIRNSSKPPR